MKHCNDVNRKIILKLSGIKIEIPALTIVLILTLPSLNYLLSFLNLNVIIYVLRLMNVLLFCLVLLNAALSYRVGRYVILLFLVLGIIFIEYIRFPINRPALEEVIPSILMQIYYFIVGHEIQDTDNVKKYLERTCLCLLFLAIIVTVFIPDSRENRIMVSNAFFLCALTFSFGKKKDSIFWIFGVISMIFIFLYGRRMHLIYFLIVICVVYLKKWYKESLKKSLVGMSIATIVVALFAFSYRYIINAIYPLLVSMGIQSRSIEMLLGNEFFDLNGRDYLFDTAIYLMKKNPFLGNGIGSTMVVAKNQLRLESSYVASNTHNGILEMGAEFGIIAMLVFIVIHLLILIRIIKMDISTSEELLLFILFATGFLAVLIGGSYLTISQYALFLGYFTSLNKRSKLKQNTVGDWKYGEKL